jgi:hypothetical protein
VSDLFIQKAKILEYLGNRQKASKCAQEGFGLDTADRGLNNIAAKFMLKNGEFEGANELILPFSSDQEDRSALNCHFLQAMWYELACASMFYNKENFRLSLKNAAYVEKHYECFTEDLLDFNNYALRKGAVNHHI